MDATALTTLVDRLRPETHTLHLPSSEITVTPQDVAMILGLFIDGTPVCGMMSSTGWRDSVGQAIGLRPADVLGDQKDRKMMNVHFGWLTAHFNTCREGAEDAVVQRYVWSCV
jgi:predicted secreted protein